MDRYINIKHQYKHWSDITPLSSKSFTVTKPALGNSGLLKFTTFTELTGDAILTEYLHIQVTERLQMTVTVTQKHEITKVELSVKSINMPIMLY